MKSGLKKGTNNFVYRLAGRAEGKDDPLEGVAMQLVQYHGITFALKAGRVLKQKVLDAEYRLATQQEEPQFDHGIYQHIKHTTPECLQPYTFNTTVWNCETHEWGVEYIAAYRIPKKNTGRFIRSAARFASQFTYTALQMPHIKA